MWFITIGITETEDFSCVECQKQLTLDDEWALLSVGGSNGYRGFFCTKCYIAMHESARRDVLAQRTVVVTIATDDDDDAG